VADREHPYRLAAHAISGDISRRPESDEKLTAVRSILIDRPQARKARQGVQPVEDGVDSARRRVGVFFRQESMKPFDV
jgi:hypothetical protein